MAVKFQGGRMVPIEDFSKDAAALNEVQSITAILNQHLFRLKDLLYHNINVRSRTANMLRRLEIEKLRSTLSDISRAAGQDKTPR